MTDPVNHPAHYTAHPSGVECIQIARHMGFNLGNVLKYIWRADLKGADLEDLRKARFYLDDEIEKRVAAKVALQDRQRAAQDRQRAAQKRSQWRWFGGGLAMTWLLVLTILAVDGTVTERPVGSMHDYVACEFAGAAMAHVILETGVVQTVTVTCTAQADT